MMCGAVAKRGNGFDKDPERARLAGRKSSNKLSEEVKFMRAKTTNEIETCVYKYLYLPIEDLKKIFTEPTLPYLDMIIIRTLIKGLELGDFGHLESVLARSIGKVADRIEVQARVETYHQIAVTHKDLPYEELRAKYFEMLKDVNKES